MTKEEFKTIANKLIDQGEDAEEMQYWIDIYDDLPAEQKEETAKTFKEELEKLESIK